MSTRTPKRGDHVLFIDVDGTVFNALVLVGWPGKTCDLVIVAPGEESRKLDQFSNVYHRHAQPMATFCWCWPDERPPADPALDTGG